MPSFKSNRSVLLGQDNNALVLLFAINALVFVLINFLKIIYFLSDIPLEFFFKLILNWFTLPANFHSLSIKPWTFIVYMFTHHSIWHLLSSLLWLWCFGFILQDLAGNNKIIPVYLYGGVVGAVFFILVNNLFPVLERNIAFVEPMLGAGSAVMAVAVATTTLAPDYRLFPMIYGGIPLWVVTLIFVAIDFATLAGGNAGIGAAHLAAGAMGYLYITQLRKGKDWGGWMHHIMDWINDLFNPEKKKKQGKEKHFYKTGPEPFMKTSNITQQKLDAILDKINVQGYPYLTDAEKEFLHKASNEDI